ncbi:MAG: hypothetical protein U0M42_09320 [Acutalibacteraceae bacterium]|nr:hypothetical protein [Acutalibacteraceae bacterium]
MKAIELYKKALSVSGQRNNEEYLVSDEKPDTIIFINSALTDLSLNTVSNLLEDISVSDELYAALIFGIAYYIALHHQDSERSEFLSVLYTQKRAKALSDTKTRKDIFSNDLRCI